MPTFLALQCYKCNMMQAKHEKKSSNKWTCSLCNEKQSVRKVFAASMAAKDIRKYVQEYNFSHNSAQDLVLAELVLNVEEERNAVFAYTDVYGDVLCGENSEARHDILSDKYRYPQVIVESKWNEYLPQEDGKYAEASEGTIDDARFVTLIPDTYARKAKGRVQSAPKNYSESNPLQQKQRKKNDDFSGGPIKKSINATQEEDNLAFADSRKVSLSSLLQSPKPASIQYGQRCSAYKMPQRIIPNVQMQAGELLGEETLMSQSFKRVSSVATRKSVGLTEMKKPVSRYAINLGEVCQEAFVSVKQETHVSKWAKYMDSDEVMQSCTKKGNLVDEPQEGSSIWSLQAASSMQHLDGLVKTELDELMDLPCMHGEAGLFDGTP